MRHGALDERYSRLRNLGPKSSPKWCRLGNLPFAILLIYVKVLPAHAQATVSYADLAPILVQRCVVCHSGETAAAGLRLDSYQGVLDGSARGAVVKAGSPAESELVRRLKGVSQPRMPMTGPPFLSEAEIAQFERWIAGGLQKGGPAASLAPAESRPGAGGKVTYLDVAPIFARRCAKCHAEEGQMGPAPEALRLTSYEATLAAFERARVVPGNPGASELLRRVRGQARPRMPFDGPPYLDAEEIGLIEAWIAQGARDAEGRPAPVPAGARVRLHGTLGEGWKLDGLDLAVGPDTRIDKDPEPGDYVQVRGRLDEAGNVMVERLRRR